MGRRLVCQVSLQQLTTALADDRLLLLPRPWCLGAQLAFFVLLELLTDHFALGTWGRRQEPPLCV